MMRSTFNTIISPTLKTGLKTPSNFPISNTQANSLLHRQCNSIGRTRFASAAAAAAPLPNFVLNGPATEVTTLPNGLRVASEGGFGETATVGVWIDAGSRYETAKNNGVAHFLEHMAFKGTPQRSQHELEVQIENMGAHLNAYTSREQTVYYAKCFKNDVEKSVQILSDILQNAKLEPDAINRERSVILREMEEVEKENEEVIFDRLHETAFQGNGLGRTILGPAENIRSITREDLQDYIKTHYTAPRIVIAGAGSVEHKQLVSLAEKYFGNLPKTSPNQKAVDLVLKTKPTFIGSEVRVRDDAKDLAYIALAFEGRGWASAESFPIMIMQTILGCWDRTSGSGANMGSMLCNTVAERELAHSIMAFNTCYKDTGLFGVYAVAEPTTVQDLMFYVLEAMVSLGHNLTEEEVQRAKTQLKSVMLSQLDGSTQICEDIGRQMLTYGRRMTPAEIFARIDAVDLKAVKKTAFDIINDRDVAMAAIGSIYEMPDYNWLRRRTFWMRA